LEKFFAACDKDERLCYEFFLMTGMREQEVIYREWPDLNQRSGTVSMKWKPAYNWTPKGYKEREIPIPTSLMASLTSARPKNSKGLIFPTSTGKADWHFLEGCKTIAHRAGLDPDDFWLHKFRATFATWHLWAGVDLRTVQEWMGHTDLASTLRYLRPARGVGVQEKVNATFEVSR
jgi:integrase/recombinase XerD